MAIAFAKQNSEIRFFVLANKIELDLCIFFPLFSKGLNFILKG